jgi:hypothetical protein
VLTILGPTDILVRLGQAIRRLGPSRAMDSLPFLIKKKTTEFSLTVWREGNQPQTT